MAPEANGDNKATTVQIPDQAVKTLTVEDMYDKEKYDLSTMEQGDVFKMLE
jgi:H+-transporting ATPase